ncbi:trace amine-associated receptor 13c-like [Hoplias malabaricus]|uniref:trace amine-associated receptor 13c-like n=1 Tax=Hoplias malabaricus TaxID=27720 RepID=UPI00346239F7
MTSPARYRAMEYAGVSTRNIGLRAKLKAVQTEATELSALWSKPKHLLMDDENYRQNITIQYCFPDNNASCRKEVKEGPGYIVLCIILSCISVSTVVLNLLVIISISHFKQLHTPTNLLILSLAVADFLVSEPSPKLYGLRPHKSLHFDPALSTYCSELNEEHEANMFIEGMLESMDDQDSRQNITIQYCYTENNLSCIKHVKEGPGYILLYFFLSCLSACTVFLNLLVIISISHFKQLHTPTNLIILSLAVADLLVGLFNMPVNIMKIMDSCWYLGTTACYIFPVITFIAVYASLYSLILIAVDRYIAITDPLQYSGHMTVRKTLMSIVLGWCIWLFYTIIFLYFNEYFIPPQVSKHCYGMCVLVVQFSWAIVDLVVAFIAPCSLILFLYSTIFKVARRQAKAVRAVNNGDSGNNGAITLRSSEIKAAKKLGTVIFVYLASYIPFYLSSVSVDSLTTYSMVWTVFCWLIFINSSINPLIYAIFYSWFRASVKYIVTCRIFESSSSRFTLFPEH